MIKIQLSPSQKRSIENQHWDYFKTTHLASLQKASKSGTSNHRDFFIWVLDEPNEYKRIKDIITGSPSVIRSIICEARSHFPMLYSDDFYSNERERIIEQKKHLPQRSKMRKATVNQFKDDTIRFIDRYSEFEGFKSVFITNPNQTNIKKALRAIEKERNKLSVNLTKKEAGLKLLKDAFCEEMLKIFDYDGFSKCESGWNAYGLVGKLNIATCPYCNRVFTSVLKTDTGKTRPALDHFYPKSIYPFLALSLYNLIPACYACNSSFKRDVDFYLNDHIHPFEMGFEGNAKFTTDLVADKDGNYLLTQISGEDAIERFKIKLSVNSPDESIKNQIINSNNTFHIEDLYFNHRDYVIEILKKSAMYNESRINELLNDEKYLSLFDSKEELISIILGNYTYEEDLSKRVLSKLTKDIWEEFGLKDKWLV